jgi:hypothetical protein
MEPNRRSILKSVGASVATIGGMSTAVDAAEFSDSGSELQFAEAAVGFHPVSENNSPHTERLPSYGVDPKESNLYLFTKNKSMVQNFTKNTQAVFSTSEGICQFPGNIFNKPDLMEVPIMEDGSMTNQFASLSSKPVSLPFLENLRKMVHSIYLMRMMNTTYEGETERKFVLMPGKLLPKIMTGLPLGQL